ncbi:MAG: nitroreductase family protein, partial [Maioricimonas sp. JB049]
LMEGNQAWCDQAAVLIVALSHKFFIRNGKPNPVHTLDTGMAMQNLLLQAASMGLVGHGMAGFHRGTARSVLNVPEEYDVEAMIAIGRPGDPNNLPQQLRKMDLSPSGRKPIAEIARPGTFGF